MDIFISRGAQDPEVRIRFPAEPDIVWPMLRELDEYCAGDEPARIVGDSSPIPNLTQYIRCADVEEAADIRKLNVLAEMVDRMSTEEQRTFSGALDAESVNGLDDVLNIASSLGQYEFLEGITSDKELGGWLVEHGQAGVDFPEEVRPYLNQVNEAIRAGLPEAKEKISWSMPTYWKGKNLIQFAVFQKHIGLYPGPEAVEAFAQQLEGYETSKGTIRLPLDWPLPLETIAELGRWCLRAYGK